jgi:acylglycerol lipase
MPHQDDELAASDGTRLFAQCWLPEGPSKAVVALVHGFTEHSGRYAKLAGDLNGQGYAVYAVDLRGHGRSAGSRCFVRSFDQYLDDLAALMEWVDRREPQRPLFLLGHSMGGTIAALYAVRQCGGTPAGETPAPQRLHGLVLSGPAVLIRPELFPVLRRLVAPASLLLPWLRVVRMGGRYVSRDPQIVDGFRSDPLVFHGRFPVRTGAEILRAARLVLREAEEIRLPLLVLHGTADRACDCRGSDELYRRAGSDDKTLRLYDGLYHEVFSEPERDQVLADLLPWLDARCEYEYPARSVCR